MSAPAYDELIVPLKSVRRMLEQHQRIAALIKARQAELGVSSRPAAG